MITTQMFTVETLFESPEYQAMKGTIERGSSAIQPNCFIEFKLPFDTYTEAAQDLFINEVCRLLGKPSRTIDPSDREDLEKLMTKCFTVDPVSPSGLTFRTDKDDDCTIVQLHRQEDIDARCEQYWELMGQAEDGPWDLMTDGQQAQLVEDTEQACNVTVGETMEHWQRKVDFKPEFKKFESPRIPTSEGHRQLRYCGPSETPYLVTCGESTCTTVECRVRLFKTEAEALQARDEHKELEHVCAAWVNDPLPDDSNRYTRLEDSVSASAAVN